MRPMNQYGRGGSKCAIIECPNYATQRDGRSFFRYPINPDVCKQWLHASGGNDLLKVVDLDSCKRLNKSTKLCADHFERKCFRNPNLQSQGLWKGSVPTLLVPFPPLEPLEPRVSVEPRVAVVKVEETWHQDLPVINECEPRFPDCSREELEFQVMLLTQHLEEAADNLCRCRKEIGRLQEENAALKANALARR